MTKKIMPEISVPDFTGANNAEIRKLADDLKKYISFSFQIPRFGTTMIYSFNEINIDWMTAVGENSSEIEKAKKLKAQIKYNTVELLWDYKKGVFTSGKKTYE